jgi:hypothetical protein
VLSHTYNGSDRLSTLTAIDGALGSNLTSGTNLDSGVHTLSPDGHNHLTGDTRANLLHW